MAVDAISSTGTALVSGKSLAGSFDTFLLLLTTQLQQQDPLSPMDAQQFTSQLVQFASVEQQIQANDRLEKLQGLLQSSTLTSGLDYLGAEVVGDVERMRLGDSGGSSFAYRLAGPAAKATLSVLDANGRTVLERSVAADTGAHTFSWDGRGSDGLRRAAGDYTVNIKALDGSGEPVAVDTSLTGTVSAVEPADDGMRVIVNGIALPVSAIREVHRPAA